MLSTTIPIPRDQIAEMNRAMLMPGSVPASSHSPKPQEPAVAVQLKQLHDVIAGLESTLCALSTRLEPVLSPPIPAAADSRNGNSGVASTGCIVSDQIASAAVNIYEKQKYLSDLLQRLQV